MWKKCCFYLPMNSAYRENAIKDKSIETAMELRKKESHSVYMCAAIVSNGVLLRCRIV